MVDDPFSAGLSTKTSPMTSCGKVVENNDTFMGLVDHAGPSPLFSRFIQSVSCRSESSKDTPTCLEIFLKLRKLKTKPNGRLRRSTGIPIHLVHPHLDMSTPILSSKMF